MATIRIRQDDLFRQSLVNMTEECYGAIIAAARHHAHTLLRTFTKRRFQSALTKYQRNGNWEKVKSRVPRGPLKLDIFVQTIETGAGSAIATVRFSLPLVAEQGAHQSIWHLLLGDGVQAPEGAQVRDGELEVRVVIRAGGEVVEEGIGAEKHYFLAPLRKKGIAA